ncbi:terminase small subunit [Oscillospiraceae bacterium 50-60]
MNQRKQAFCEAYLISGNATDAAREAGYSPWSARSIGQRLLTFNDVREYLEQRNQEISAANTAQTEEVRQFWTATMRDENMKSADRLKASEPLAKTYGAFLERVEVDADLKTREVMASMPEEELRTLAQMDGDLWE